MILPASSSDSMPSLIKISYNSDESKFAKSSLLLMPLSPNLIIWDEFNSSKLIITTNGFTNKLIQQDLKPARAQVLITKPITNLNIKGTFHLDCGYYYFRNIDNRILLGGGRNLDFMGETTTEMSTTAKIQNELESLLHNVIFPNKNVDIDQRWSGIMGVGQQKLPLIRQYSDCVFVGVRMGGMGVALGAGVAKKIVDLIP